MLINKLIKVRKETCWFSFCFGVPANTNILITHIVHSAVTMKMKVNLLFVVNLYREKKCLILSVNKMYSLNNVSLYSNGRELQIVKKGVKQ